LSDLLVIGGPNGAGKTTAAKTLLPHFTEIVEFVNADEIARGLSPFNPEGSALAAGRIMLERMRSLTEAGTSFAFETTCAGGSHVRLIRRCQDFGYRVTLLFFWLPSPDLAIARVAHRVQQGGHTIPSPVIRRRYQSGLVHLLRLYWPAVAQGAILDAEIAPAQPIIEKFDDGRVTIHNADLWQRIQEQAP
jgi:predicted ABC-type ATPase